MSIYAIILVWNSISQFTGWRFPRVCQPSTVVSGRRGELVLLFRQGSANNFQFSFIVLVFPLGVISYLPLYFLVLFLSCPLTLPSPFLCLSDNMNTLLFPSIAEGNRSIVQGFVR